VPAKMRQMDRKERSESDRERDDGGAKMREKAYCTLLSLLRRALLKNKQKRRKLFYTKFLVIFIITI
jgi:hypothetical protein